MLVTQEKPCHENSARKIQGWDKVQGKEFPQKILQFLSSFCIKFGNKNENNVYKLVLGELEPSQG